MECERCGIKIDGGRLCGPCWTYIYANNDVGKEVRKVDENSKHTPGPWSIQPKVILPDYTWVVEHVKEDGRRVIVGSAWKTDDKIASTKDDETGQANARLIAAAPDMYSLLREMFDGGPHLTEKLYNKIEACLEKIK